jgi:hypothetical protein
MKKQFISLVIIIAVVFASIAATAEHFNKYYDDNGNPLMWIEGDYMITPNNVSIYFDGSQEYVQYIIADQETASTIYLFDEDGNFPINQATFSLVWTGEEEVDGETISIPNGNEGLLVRYQKNDFGTPVIVIKTVEGEITSEDLSQYDEGYLVDTDGVEILVSFLSGS